MGERRFILLMLILFLNFLGTIFAIFGKHGLSFKAHGLLSVFFILIAIIALAGIYKDMPWAWQLSMLLFAALLIHLIILYMGAGRLGMFIIIGLLDLIGFLVSVASIESYEERKWRLEEYSNEDADKIGKEAKVLEEAEKKIGKEKKGRKKK